MLGVGWGVWGGGWGWVGGGWGGVGQGSMFWERVWVWSWMKEYSLVCVCAWASHRTACCRSPPSPHPPTHALPTHPHRPMPAGLHHERAGQPRPVELHPLVDDVLVALLEAQVSTAQGCSEGRGSGWNFRSVYILEILKARVGDMVEGRGGGGIINTVFLLGGGGNIARECMLGCGGRVARERPCICLDT
jgi:hypothetical protein